MSASSSIPPNNLIMLAVLGAGAYWFLTRRAAAAQGTPAAVAAATAANRANNTAGTVDAAGRLIGGLVNLFGGKSSAPSTGTYDGRSALPWDTTPVDGVVAYNNPSAYLSSAVDGVAANPVVSSPYDYGAYF